MAQSLPFVHAWVMSCVCLISSKFMFSFNRWIYTLPPAAHTHFCKCHRGVWWPLLSLISHSHSTNGLLCPSPPFLHLGLGGSERRQQPTVPLGPATRLNSSAPGWDHNPECWPREEPLLITSRVPAAGWSFLQENKLTRTPPWLSVGWPRLWYCFLSWLHQPWADAQAPAAVPLPCCNA